MPSSSLYRHRFGSLLRAYSLIGYAPDRDYRYIEINRHIRQSFPKLLAEIVAGFENAGGSVVCDPVSELLLINREFTASIVFARSFETHTGSLRLSNRIQVRPLFASKNDPSDGAETGGAEPHIAEQSRSWRAANGEQEVMRGS